MGLGERAADRQEVVTEMSGAIGSVFLGLTVGCARCHNHKFDPILQSDYYQLQAIFRSTELKDAEIATPEQKAVYYWAKKDYDARLEPVKKALEENEKRARAVLREKKFAELEPKLRDALAIPEDKRTAEEKTLAKNAKEQ